MAGTATRKVQSKLTRLLAQDNMCKVQALSLQDMLFGAMVRPMLSTREERQVNLHTPPACHRPCPV